MGEQNQAHTFLSFQTAKEPLPCIHGSQAGIPELILKCLRKFPNTKQKSVMSYSDLTADSVSTQCGEAVYTKWTGCRHEEVIGRWGREVCVYLEQRKRLQAKETVHNYLSAASSMEDHCTTLS